MKEIIITPKQLKKELLYWLYAFGLANILNIYSIIKYQTNWMELFTQIGYVFVLSIIIYLLLVFIRMIVRILKRNA